MPTNKFIQSLLNPVKFVDMEPPISEKYLSRHMDDFFYFETIKPWQQRRHYYQLFQTNDRIYLQFQSEMTPITIKLIDADERVYITVVMEALAYDFDNPDLFLYEGSIGLGVAPGLYFLKAECGEIDSEGNFPLTLLSEPIDIAIEHKHSLFLQYSHDEYYNDIAFETGIQPEIRLRATLRFKTPASKDTFFEDQPLNLKMLRSKPFRVYELRIGGACGIPDYLADMINRILGCSTLLIDGRAYTKSDGAKMEESAAPNYPMRGWTVELRETENVVSKIFENGFWLLEDSGLMLLEDGGSTIL